jgi:transposase-like protein
MTASKLFPCPFCRSLSVAAIGGGRQFVHYRCTDCAEVWTAQSSTVRGARIDPPQVPDDDAEELVNGREVVH